VGLSPNYLLY